MKNIRPTGGVTLHNIKRARCLPPIKIKTKTEKMLSHKFLANHRFHLFNVDPKSIRLQLVFFFYLIK